MMAKSCLGCAVARIDEAGTGYLLGGECFGARVRSEDGRMCRRRILSRGGGDEFGKICGGWIKGRWRGGDARVLLGDAAVLFGDAMVLWREGRIEGGNER